MYPFDPLPVEMRVPLNKQEHDFQFTRRWFEYRNLTTWSTFLLPRFGLQQPVNMLQIGVFEGMDLVWCCQNLLQHPDSRAVAIDPWLETTKLKSEQMLAVRDRAAHNLTPWDKKIQLIQRFSQDVVPQLPAEQFDLAIIDGDHNRRPVYDDAVNCLRTVKSGGWLVFDDVRNRVKKADHVQAGLDDFLKDHGGSVLFEWRHRYCDCYSKR